MKNLGVKINYLFRDENNYKLFGCQEFTNMTKQNFEFVKNSIANKLIDGEYFYPRDFNINKFQELQFELNENWYELDSIEEIILEDERNIRTDIKEII